MKLLGNISIKMIVLTMVCLFAILLSNVMVTEKSFAMSGTCKGALRLCESNNSGNQGQVDECYRCETEGENCSLRIEGQPLACKNNELKEFFCGKMLSNIQNESNQGGYCDPKRSDYNACLGGTFNDNDNCKNSGATLESMQGWLPPYTPCVITDPSGIKDNGQGLSPGEISCTNTNLPAVYVGHGITAGCNSSNPNDPNSPNINDPNKNTISCVIYNMIDLLLKIFGALIVVMVIISGVLYMTSMGNSNSVSWAKKALTGAIIGFLIVVLARFGVSLITHLIG